MNQLVARAFASIMNALHVIFFLGVLVGVVVVSRNDNNLGQAALIILGLIVGYVVVMGYLATVISINENLSAIRHTLESEISSKVPPQNTVFSMERAPQEPSFDRHEDTR
jgi:hypothetical protein